MKTQNYRPDTPSSWDEGACVIYLVQSNLAVPTQHRLLKPKHYIRYLQSTCKRLMFNAAVKKIEATGLPKDDAKQLIDCAAASIHARVCPICQGRVPAGSECKCESGQPYGV